MPSADEKLVSQTLAGDRDAFGVLVHKYQDMVYTYAFQKVRNEADAQDITQEVFLRAYRRLFKLRQPHLFRSWLYTIMCNECNRWLERVMKKRRREVILEEAAEESLKIEPAHAVPVEGWQVDLEQALSALPDDNRVAVSMFYMGDCTLKEISEFLGVSVNTVKGKLHRARQQLGAAMSEHYAKLLKSHKLKGGFLMQFMEQIRYIPAPTMGFAWGSASVGKTLFALITALCILIGLVGGREDAPMDLPMTKNQIRVAQISTNRWPIEVAFLAPTVDSPRSPISGIPVPAGKRPLAVSSGASTEQGGRSIDREVTSATNGAKPSNPQSSAVMAENPSEKLTFSGRVVDGDGEPVADAEVLYSVKSNTPKSVTRTGTDGTFRFELAHPESNEQDLVDIIAAHPKHASGWQALRAKSTVDVEIQLEEPAIISGSIVNKLDEPIQNAEVQIKALLRDSHTFLRFENNPILNLIPIPTVKTDVNGSFIFRRLPKGRMATLYVQGQGYARERQAGVPTGTEGLQFRLEPEARIEGRLSYAETGAPVESATVSVEGIHPTEGWGQASVDANGNYVVKNLGPGTYNVYLQEGPVGLTAAANAVIKVGEGQTVSNVDLTLIRAGFVTGRITDQDTNEPIVFHYVSLYDAARPAPQGRSHSVHTDETGTYRFNAAPGAGLVIVYTPQGYQDVGHIEEDVDVVEAQTVVVDFQFSKGTPLICRILTETGEPVPGARITDAYEGYIEYGISNERGELSIHGLRHRPRLKFAAEHSDLKLRGSTEVEIQPGASVEIRMKSYKSVKVSGRVVNPKGEPVPSVNIDRMRWDPERHEGISSTVAVTDGEGRFQGITLIVGDQYGIYARTEGYREAKTELFTATTEMNQISDLVLQPAGGPYFIEGRITDTSGKPVNGARLIASQQSQHWETLTDANGDYRLENLSMVVLYQLEIIHPDYAHHTFEILKTNQRHDLVLVKADGYLAGKVVDAAGKPIYRASVSIDPQEDPVSGVVYPSVATDGQGEFELEYIKDLTVSIDVGTDHAYGVFEDIKVNQRDLVLTLTPTEPIPAPTLNLKQQTRWAYEEESEERFKTLMVGKPAPELAVEEWLTGDVSSIRDLKGNTIVLDFWESGNSDNIQSVRLLNLLHEIYQQKELVCVTIFPATEEVESVKQHISEHSLEYPIGLDSPTEVVGANGETFDRYAIGGRGSIVLINTGGEITGAVYPWDLGDQIQNLFAD